MNTIQTPADNAPAGPGLVRSAFGHAAPWRTPTTWNGKPRLLMIEVHSPAVPAPAQSTPAVAYILTEREEHYEHDDQGNVSRARIRLWYERLQPPRLFDDPRPNLCFEGSYHTGWEAKGIVSLTSTSLGHGAVYLDLKGLEGHRIGTYLMNEIVSWAKQWPQAEVHPVQLLASQATQTNTARRNRFYTQFGLSFDFEDARELAGMSRPITADQMNTVDTWQLNIQEHTLDAALLNANEAARDAKSRLYAFQAQHERDRTATARRRIRWRRVFAVALVAFVLAVLATASALHRFDRGRSEHPRPTTSSGSRA